jgi:DNA-binding CsgD family transcriptional regulator
VPIATRLGHSDYEAALSLVAEAADTSGAQPFELSAIERLLRTIPAERAGYFEYGGGGVVDGTPNTFFVDHPCTCEPDWESDTVRATVSSWPLQDIPRVPNVSYGAPLKLSDFLTGARLRRNPWYCEVMKPNGIEHELKVWLPTPKGTCRGFFLVRTPGQRDFGERDRAVLSLVRPYFARIRARWERRHRPSVLTKREAEVLELVAQGLTNAEVAARLVVSRDTVRTHLENIFSKLGVHTRTAAVAHVRGANAGVWGSTHRPETLDRAADAVGERGAHQRADEAF